MLREVYWIVSLGYLGKVMVLVFWDKKMKIIVNNEFSEIIWMFNKEFNVFCVIEE